MALQLVSAFYFNWFSAHPVGDPSWAHPQGEATTAGPSTAFRSPHKGLRQKTTDNERTVLLAPICGEVTFASALEE